MGNFLQIHCHGQPAHGLDIGQNHAGDGSAWTVESFTKTSVLFGWFKYFQKHWLSQSSYFIKPLQISTVFLFFFFFHVDMEAKGRKNVATCMFSTSYFQVFGFFRHESQWAPSPMGCGASRLFSLFPRCMKS